MASGLIIIPNFMPALDRNGDPVPGAKMYFYLDGTTVPTIVYADPGLTTPLTNPLPSDSSGVFVAAYANKDVPLTVAVTDADGIPLAPPYTGVYPASAAASAAAAAAAAQISANAANADRLLADADVVLTHEDVVLTHADVVQTGLDRTQTGADVITANAAAAGASGYLAQTQSALLQAASGMSGFYGPGFGYADAAALAPTNQLTLNAAGNLSSYINFEGLRVSYDKNGVKTYRPQTFNGPSYGYVNNHLAVITEVKTNATGSGTTFIDGSGLIYIAEPGQNLAYLAQQAFYGPSFGWGYSLDATPPAKITLNALGYFDHYYMSDGSRIALNPSVQFYVSNVGVASAAASFTPSVLPTLYMNDETTFVASQASTTVALPAMTLTKLSANVTILAQNLTLPALTSLSPIVDETAANGHTHNISQGSQASASWYLPYRFFSSLVVKKVSDSSVIVRGTDYQYVNNVDDGGQGMARFWGLTSAAYAVKCSYQPYNSRVDYIYADMESGVLGSVQGTERGIDPEVYQPTLPATKLLAFVAYVTAQGVELLPALKFRNGIKIGDEAKWLAIQQYNYGCLPKTLATAAAGGSIDLFTYYDSRGSYGGATTPYVSPSNNIQILANQASQDSQSYFSGRMPNDTVATYTPYGLSDADFASYVSDGVHDNTHVKLSSDWYWTRAMRASYPACTIRKRNRCVSGSTSDSSISNSGTGNDRLNGLQTNRIGALITDIQASVTASRTPVVFMAWGMNDLPGTGVDEYGNIVSLITQIRAAGAEVIIEGCEHPSVDRAISEANMALINEQEIGAGIYKKAAIVPVMLIEAAGYEGACGLSKQFFGNNDYNHCTPFQNAQDGTLLAMLTVPHCNIVLPGQVTN